MDIEAMTHWERREKPLPETLFPHSENLLVQEGDQNVAPFSPFPPNESPFVSHTCAQEHMHIFLAQRTQAWQSERLPEREVIRGKGGGGGLITTYKQASSKAELDAKARKRRARGKRRRDGWRKRRGRISAPHLVDMSHV
ncbi:hypothetical protein IE53DRAFT_188832 [Violaceomyces palustris]|uniref:Uncharacterized protein n=1 Tax=Violaceomyces palustris TaxID=1673888 RepID=A0ACD0P8G6_9BASI|nr:hypothetical protein IE53DRAFT_188832 [Violaceomyces palustris]